MRELTMKSETGGGRCMKQEEAARCDEQSQAGDSHHFPEFN